MRITTRDITSPFLTLLFLTLASSKPVRLPRYTHTVPITTLQISPIRPIDNQFREAMLTAWDSISLNNLHYIGPDDDANLVPPSVPSCKESEWGGHGCLTKRREIENLMVYELRPLPDVKSQRFCEHMTTVVPGRVAEIWPEEAREGVRGLVKGVMEEEFAECSKDATMMILS